MRSSLDVHSVVQAGGRGSRHPSSDHTPKPLLEVGGIPIIERLLRQQVSCGVRSFTIITGWLGDSIQERIVELKDLAEQAEFRFVRESIPRGNIGSIDQIRNESGPIVFSFADLVTDLDFAELISIHRKRGSSVTLASHHEEHRLTLGELQIDGAQVVGYLEKPLKRFLICSGIAVFDPPVLAMIEPGAHIGLSDLVNLALHNGFGVTHWTHGAYWMDINTPEALEHANTSLKKEGINAGNRPATREL